MKTLKNCIKCYSSYEPYKTGKGEDIGSYQSALSVRDENGKVMPPSGLCQKCNPQSILYMDPEKCYALFDDGCGKMHAAEERHP
jgi:hypothetical protein